MPVLEKLHSQSLDPEASSAAPTRPREYSEQRRCKRTHEEGALNGSPRSIKRRRTEPPGLAMSSGPPIKLTRDNLRRFDKAMASSSPAKRAKRSQSQRSFSTLENSNRTRPRTPQPTIAISSSNWQECLCAAGRRLRRVTPSSPPSSTLVRLSSWCVINHLVLH
jgi:hypothetical protein